MARYTLQAPLEITSRLMVGARVGNGTISIDYGRQQVDGRIVYDVWIDLPGGEYHIDDLQSGCQGGDLKEGLTSLLSFLMAAAESRQYRERTGRDGENEDLFDPAVVDWASQYSDELSLLQCEIEESDEILIEE